MPDDRTVGSDKKLEMTTAAGEDLSGDQVEDFDIHKNRIPLREIFISVEMIKDVVSTSNTPSEILKGIMSRILESSNHIIDLGLASNNYGYNNLALVDKKLIPDADITTKSDMFNNLLIFNPYSPDTIVKEYDLSYSMPQGGLGNILSIQTMGDIDSIPVDSLLDKTFTFELLNNKKNKELDDYFVKFIQINFKFVILQNVLFSLIRKKTLKLVYNS